MNSRQEWKICTHPLSDLAPSVFLWLVSHCFPIYCTCITVPGLGSCVSVPHSQPTMLVPTWEMLARYSLFKTLGCFGKWHLGTNCTLPANACNKAPLFEMKGSIARMWFGVEELFGRGMFNHFPASSFSAQNPPPNSFLPQWLGRHSRCKSTHIWNLMGRKQLKGSFAR